MKTPLETGAFRAQLAASVATLLVLTTAYQEEDAPPVPPRYCLRLGESSPAFLDAVATRVAAPKPAGRSTRYPIKPYRLLPAWLRRQSSWLQGRCSSSTAGRPDRFKIDATSSQPRLLDRFCCIGKKLELTSMRGIAVGFCLTTNSLATSRALVCLRYQLNLNHSLHGSEHLA